MITGRDDEFRATITFFYRQELGRDPDPGGMASHLDFARNGGTGEQSVVLSPVQRECVRQFLRGVKNATA